MEGCKLLTVGAALLGAVLLVSGHASPAQEWPTKPVKLIVPFAAAGTTDRMARLVAAELSQTFKQQFYVENRVGSGGVVGTAAVARADDGHTLLMAGYGGHVFGPATLPHIGYDPIGDFAHIAMVGGESYVLVAHSSLGLKSFDDFLRWAKSRNEPINVGSAGQGSLGHIVVEQMKRKPGLLPNLNHVPYRGGGPLLTDLIGNHVSVAANALSPTLEHIANGTLVPLALISQQRNPVTPDLPTFAELGHPDIGGAIWAWIAGPKSLPAPVVAKLNTEVRRWIASPETKERFRREAFLSMDLDPPALTKFVEGELKRWTAFIQEAGLKTQ
jgi:tripartite-type tricarboxylate transporter receptor subunit TctC